MYTDLFDECYELAENLVEDFVTEVGTDATIENLDEWHAWLLNNCENEKLRNAMQHWIECGETFTKMDFVEMAAAE